MLDFTESNNLANLLVFETTNRQTGKMWTDPRLSPAEAKALRVVRAKCRLAMDTKNEGRYQAPAFTKSETAALTKWLNNHIAQLNTSLDAAVSASAAEGAVSRHWQAKNLLEKI